MTLHSLTHTNTCIIDIYMWYSVSCPDRLLIWREWRKGLDRMDLETAVHAVASTYMLVPRINHYLAADEKDRWPTPWELVMDNHYCDLAVALGMFYALSLSKHAEHGPEILIYKDTEKHSWYHLCSIANQKYILNWDQGRIVNTPTLPSGAHQVHRYKEIDLAAQLG